jgi:uncharacterized protein (TIGR02246 family)
MTMKKYSLILILAITCTSSLSAAEQGINAIGETWVKVFQANDLEAVIALYAPNAHMFPPDAMEAVGKDAIRANYAGVMNNFTIQDMKIVDAHHETVGDLSFAWGRYSVTLVPKSGGEPVRMEGRFSDVSRKINGRWLYIVDHASVAPPPLPSKPSNQ